LSILFSTCNKRKLVVATRLIKNKIIKPCTDNSGSPKKSVKL
jgi:hypothetical protein